MSSARACPGKSLGRFRPFFATGFRHAVVTVLSSLLFSDADLVGSTFSRRNRVEK